MRCTYWLVRPPEANRVPHPQHRLRTAFLPLLLFHPRNFSYLPKPIRPHTPAIVEDGVMGYMAASSEKRYETCAAA